MKQHALGTTAILLASGNSSRFGKSDKLFHPFLGKPMATYLLETVCASGLFSRVIFVTARKQVAVLAEGLPVVGVRNRQPDRGICESIRIGTAAAGDCNVMFFPCDQPLLDTTSIERILTSVKTEADIVIPTYRGQKGSPVWFASIYRQELMTLENGESGKQVIARHMGQVRYVEMECAEVLEDIDTLAQLDKLSKRFGKEDV